MKNPTNILLLFAIIALLYLAGLLQIAAYDPLTR